MQDKLRPADKLAEESLSFFSKNYSVMNKSHITSWKAWLVIGIVVGIAAGVMFVASNTEKTTRITQVQLASTKAQASIPAFPGAEGFGAQSIGGRGGRVIEVTNLNNSGTGSLKDCVGASGARICVFRVAGEIVLSSQIRVQNPFLTIAGQTAPGGGITIRGNGDCCNPLLKFTADTHNIIIRYIKVRLGHSTEDNPDFQGESFLPSSERRTWDAITFRSGSDIILDHVSVQWGTDEVLTANPDPGATIKNITIQRTIIAEGLRGHSTGSLFVSTPSEGRTTSRVSIHHSIYAHNAHRNPRGSADNLQFVNSVVYNWLSRVGNTTKGAIWDYVNNVYIRGPWSGGRYLQHESCPFTKDGSGVPRSETPSIYIEGNIFGTGSNPNSDQWSFIRHAYNCTIYSRADELPLSWRRNTPITAAQFPVTIQPANDARTSVLADVGDNARLDNLGNWVSRQDIIDRNIIRDIKNGTGPGTAEENDHQDDYGGFPTIDPGTKYADTDSDGMADDWENRYFGTLSRGSASDSSLFDFDNDGYTDLEEFLNGSDPTGGDPLPPPPPVPPPPPGPPPPAGPPPPPIAGIPMWIEAETGILTFPMTQASDSNASNGAYIHVPTGSNSRSPVPEATYSIEIPQTGTYYLWGRIHGPTDSNDAIYIGINSSWDRMFPVALNTYEWVRVETVHNTGNFGHSLTQGTHTIQVGHGEISARLDALYLTNDPNEIPPSALE